MRAIISWTMIGGGAAVVLAAAFYLPAALAVDDISGLPLAILIVISIVGVVLAALGLVLLRRNARPS